MIKYLKETDMKGVVLKTDLGKRIECYVGTEFSGGWNQYKGKEPISFLSITGYVIAYAKCPIIWTLRIHTEIYHSTTEADYITLSKPMRFFFFYESYKVY